MLETRIMKFVSLDDCALDAGVANQRSLTLYFVHAGTASRGEPSRDRTVMITALGRSVRRGCRWSWSAYGLARRSWL